MEALVTCPKCGSVCHLSYDDNGFAFVVCDSCEYTTVGFLSSYRAISVRNSNPFIDKLKEEISEKQSQIYDLDEDVDYWKGQYTAANNECESLKADVAYWKEQYNDLDDEKEKLQEKYEESEENFSSLDKDYSNAVIRISDLEMECEGLGNDVDYWKGLAEG